MPVQIQDIEQAQKTVLGFIAHRSDGEKFIPIYQRLEQELSVLKSQSNEHERILNLAADLTTHDQ